MGEMRGFARNNPRQHWLWQAIERGTDRRLRSASARMSERFYGFLSYFT